MGFFGGLTLLFIALKLTGYVQWSWLIVLAPAIAWPFFMFAVLIVITVAERREYGKSLRRHNIRKVKK